MTYDGSSVTADQREAAKFAFLLIKLGIAGFGNYTIPFSTLISIHSGKEVVFPRLAIQQAMMSVNLEYLVLVPKRDATVQ